LTFTAHSRHSNLLRFEHQALISGDAWEAGLPHQANLIEVTRAAEPARDLVHQLLAFARKQTFELKILDMNSVISGLEKMLRRHAASWTAAG